ncbi:MAG: hypothetical protein LPH19_11720 [Shewanella sp.]|nr:hypothetical protein [Shewanella sp.]MCF1431913.1 hypothetical protein [Shewanella sp.]
MTKKKSMTKEAAARIQAAESKKQGGKVDKGTFAPRAQRAAEHNSNKSDNNQ